jgi:TPR repeat protein
VGANVKRRIKAFLDGGVLALALFGAAAAGPLEDAQDLDRYRKAAEQGDALAQTHLGVLYALGLFGVPKDYAQSVAWYRKAAEQGNVLAQNNLGAMYEHGLGVPQDYEQAVAWYRKAAEQGDALAQNNLGLMYRDGRGVPQDYVRAHVWLNLAASDTGYTEAAKNRDDVAAKMTPAQIAEAQRLAREWKPK